MTLRDVRSGLKLCVKCGVEKTLDAFSRHKRDGVSSWCKSCSNANCKKWRAEGDNTRRMNLRRFGITPEDYDAMHDHQAGLCLICHQPETKQQRGRTRKLCVDHDHATGKVRGLLCQNCNSAIGMLEDDVTRLESAINYLKERV